MTNYDDLLNNTYAEGQSGQLSKEDYAVKKHAEREAVFELSDKTVMEAAGSGDKLRQFLDLQSKFDRYSAVNVLLIMAQKPEATRIGDFNHWKNQGGFVKSGQASISILEPHEYLKEDGSPGTGYNIKKVFDISQVDARKVKTTLPPVYTERQLLAALISKAPMKISGIDNLSGNLGAYTDPQSGEIFVRKGMDFADTFRSAARELCYAEVQRNGNTTTDPKFTAYCAAYILCKKYGVDTQAFSFESSPSMFRGFETQNIKQAFSAIRDAAEPISGRMVKHLETLNRADKNSGSR